MVILDSSSYLISLTSGNWPLASRLSAVSSVVLIGKVGVETFWSRHNEKLSQTSILVKFCIAALVLPVFVLTATFKLTAHCLIKLRSEIIYPVTILLGIGLPTLTLFIVPCIIKDLAVNEIGSGVFSQLLVLHLWPKNSHGKRINLAMAVFSFFLLSSSLPFMIVNPEPQTLKWTQDRGTLFSSIYERRQWSAELNERVRITSISLLVLGTVALFFTICLILFEDRWVAGIVSIFPKVSNKDHKSIESGVLALPELDQKSVNQEPTILTKNDPANNVKEQ